MTLLEVKDLNISFDIDDEMHQVIYGVDFDLESGKMLGIVGESGCGKTITSMAVLNLLPPNAAITKGSIKFKDTNLLDLNQKQMQKIRGNKIALIPQDPLTSLNPLYTVGDQILEAVMLHQNVDKKTAREIAIKSLEQVHIPEAEKRFDDYPHQFSGGMCQRVIIAMALSCKPEIIIADEPTTALDVTVQAQIMHLFKEIQKEMNTSVILITHDLALISEVADDVLVMYAGRVVEHACAKEIFNNPQHPYTQGLLKALPKADVVKLAVIEGQPPSVQDEIVGCPFNPRCKYVMGKCRDNKPQLVDIGNGHKVSCWLMYDKLKT